MVVTVSVWVFVCLFVIITTNLGVLVYVLDKLSQKSERSSTPAEDRIYAALDSNSIEFVEAVFIYDGDYVDKRPDLRSLLIRRADRLRTEEARRARLDAEDDALQEGDDDDDIDDMDEDR